MAKWQDLIEALDDGRVGEQLGEVLSEAISAVEIHGGKAEVSLKLNIVQAGNRAVVTATVPHKIPREQLGETQLWFADGELRRENPRQVKMNLRELDDQEVR